MNRAFFKRLGIVLTIFGLMCAIPFLWRAWVIGYYSGYMMTATDVPADRVAIVFGARIYSDGRLSGMLRDRVDTAIQLYKTGKVDKLLMSGDNSIPEYDEPTSMMRYAVEHGVPAADIQPDYAGRRTYDTCYRAKTIFQINSAILVTQEFHLSRALYTCRHIGLDAIGVPSDIQRYSRSSLWWSHVREIPATLLAWWDTWQQQPAAILGEPIPLK